MVTNGKLLLKILISRIYLDVKFSQIMHDQISAEGFRSELTTKWWTPKNPVHNFLCRASNGSLTAVFRVIEVQQLVSLKGTHDTQSINPWAAKKSLFSFQIHRGRWFEWGDDNELDNCKLCSCNRLATTKVVSQSKAKCVIETASAEIVINTYVFVWDIDDKICLVPWLYKIRNYNTKYKENKK